MTGTRPPQFPHASDPSESTTGEATSRYPFAPLDVARLAPEEALARSNAFLEAMRGRRSIRAFSPEPMPYALIENAIATAITAPSGANQQPWRFVVIGEPALKRRLREVVEVEERANYEHRFPPEWLSALAPLGTDWHKEFLETAPYVIVVLKEEYGIVADAAADSGERHIKHYYATESVGIAVGLLIASLTMAGLAVLTHTPSPMGNIRELLGRPRNEKPYVLLPVGYPAPDCRVPVLRKKSLDEVLILRTGEPDTEPDTPHQR